MPRLRVPAWAGLWVGLSVLPPFVLPATAEPLALEALRAAWAYGLPPEIAALAPHEPRINLLATSSAPLTDPSVAELLQRFAPPWNEASPWDLVPSGGASILGPLEEGQLIEIRYGKHEELERLLQKLYFQLMRGPVLMTVAYDPSGAPAGYRDWLCFQGTQRAGIGGDNDVHRTWVRWESRRTIAVYLSGGDVWIWDRGTIYRGDHNALVAAGIAAGLAPEVEDLAHWTIPRQTIRDAVSSRS